MENFRTFPRGEFFHLCNKSISNYHIFRKENWIAHFLTTINYYNNSGAKICLSKALRKPLDLQNMMIHAAHQIVHILAYCIMPDHYHLLVKVNGEYLLSKYISDIENSYTHYYNNTLLHVHRYIHLNPTTAGFTEKPEDHKWSSYNYYISNPQALFNTKIMTINSISTYRQFVEDQIGYQRTIGGIRRKLLE